MEKRVRNSLCFTLLFILAFANTTLAQVGKIYGKITDKSTQSPAEMATVVLQGTAYGALTDGEGVFVIEAPAGTYTLMVKLTEYKDLVVSDVVVTAGQNTEVNRSIEVMSSSIDTIQITAPVQRSSTVGLMSFRRLDDGMVVGVSAMDIARSPDRNTGQVLRRVSGASIQENRFVVIRGLSDRYNVAQVNGMALPSSEPDRRAFSFDIFPSGMLDNLIIQKTATPDLPGNFAGGVIQLNTKDIPEKRFVNLSLSSNYNTQSTFKPFLTYEGSKQDWLGTGGAARALPSDIPSTAEFKAQLTSIETRYTASKLMHNDWALQSKSSMMPGVNFNLGMGDHKQIGRHDFGVILGGLYQNNRRLIVSERADFNLDTTRIFSFVDHQYREEAQLGGLANLSYSFDSTQKISFKTLYNQTGEDLVVERSGVDYANEQNIKANSMQYTGTTLLSGQLSGSHRLSKTGVELRWGGTYSKLKRTVPDLRRMYYVENFGDSVFQAYVPPGAPSPNYAGKYYGGLGESLAGADLSLALPYHIGAHKQRLQGGFSSQFRDRTFESRVFGYVIGRTSTFDWSRLTDGQDSIFDQSAIGTDGFRLAESTNPSDSYTAGSKLVAGYFLSDNHLPGRVRVVWGARVEQYQQVLNTVTYGGDTIALDTTTIDILPSVNVSWELSSNKFVRLAASRTVSRPEFRELAPFSFYDFNTSSSVYGNDSLVRSHITNLDARFEIYPRAGQLISGTVFYKHFDNPIEQVIDASSGSGSRIYTYQNVPTATNFGAELEVRLKANRIDSVLHWSGWDKITWSANLSYIYSQVNLSGVASQIGNDSTRALQGQSPYLINTGLQYFDVVKGFSFSVLFNRIGRRIFQVGSNGFLDIYEAPRSVIDFQASVRVLKRCEIKLNYSDMLNQKNVFYQDQNKNGKYDAGTDTQFYGNRFGSNISLGFGLNF
jgi:outer membrane receptor protein involved in Fe transport